MLLSRQEIVALVFLTITGYNVLEFSLWLLDTFPARRGLYFWSMLIATISLATYTPMVAMGLFAPNSTSLVQLIGFNVSVPILITAHILALYSRLYILMQTSHTNIDRNRLILRCILVMIIATSIMFTIPVTVTLTLYTIDLNRYATANFTTERIAFTSYSVRELFVCGIYLVQGLQQIRPIARTKGKIGKTVMGYLVGGQLIVMIVDVIFVVVMLFGRRRWGFAEHLETSFMGMVYMLKLKLEFIILNRLVLLLDSPVQRLGSSIIGAGGGLINTSSMTAAAAPIAEYKGLPAVAR